MTSLQNVNISEAEGIVKKTWLSRKRRLDPEVKKVKGTNDPGHKDRVKANSHFSRLGTLVPIKRQVAEPLFLATRVHERA